MASIKTLAQAALATIITNHAEVVVTVVANGNSASCIKDTKTGDANLSENGEVGLTTGTVRGNADTLGVVTNGQAITVDGAQAFVMQHRTDPTGAILAIDYQLQKPVTGTGDVL